jgi:hypothetical protein
MAELVSNLAATTDAATADRSWLPFEELVTAHRGWQAGEPGAEADYRRKLQAFQAKYGEIVESYWCSSVASAVALTSKSGESRRWLQGRSPRYEFHRVSDWATKNEPEVAALLHRCDELAVKVDRILRGPTRRILMRLVSTSASHLLSLVDDPSSHRKTDDRREALEFERKALDATGRYYEEVGLRQSQIVYFLGMLIGGAVITAIATGVWLAGGRDFSNRVVLAIVLGAAGALISVMSRMASRDRKFAIDYELGRAPVLVLGSFRPVIGAAFGLVV